MTNDDLVAFFDSRSGWLEVAAVPRIEGGHGWDVVLRLDGTYYGSADGGSLDALGIDPQGMAEYFARWLNEAMVASGLPPSAKAVRPRSVTA